MEPAETGAPTVVTAIIPTYDRRELVREAVESALAQTFAELEVIVADDGSTDGTADALEREYGTRITVLRRPHGGVSAARNAALAEARGEIVAFLDSDQRWLPDHVETVVATFGKFPEAVLVSTYYERREGTDRSDDAQLVDDLPRLLSWNPIGWVSCCACRRGDLIAVDGFDERLVVAEDHDLYVRLALRGPFAVLNRPVVPHPSGLPDSLEHRGRRDGLYLDCLELSLAGLVEKLASSSRPDREVLARETRARLALHAAIRAILAGDDEAARSALTRACELWPAFSNDQSAVAAVVRWNTPAFHLDSQVRLHMLERMASLWPEQRSETARVLRLKSLDAARDDGGIPAVLRAATRVPPRHASLAVRHVLWLARGGTSRST